MKIPRSSHAFTLIELLVVIAIVGVLVGIAFPIFGRVQEQGRRAACVAIIHQISVATMLYSADNNMTFPPAQNAYDNAGGTRWTGFIAPYMGSSGSAGTTTTANFLYNTTIYGCPSDKVVRSSNLKVYQKCSYALSYQVQNGDSSGDTPPYRISVVTHPSKAILIAERWDSGNLAHYPLGSSQNILQSSDFSKMSLPATGFHSGNSVSNYAMVDGHVETLSSTDTTNLWNFKQ